MPESPRRRKLQGSRAADHGKLRKYRENTETIMNRQCTCDALSTEAMIGEIGHPVEDQKLGIRDFAILAERVAVTLGGCVLLHAIM